MAPIEGRIAETPARFRALHNARRAMLGETISHYRILEKLGGGGMGAETAC